MSAALTLLCRVVRRRVERGEDLLVVLADYPRLTEEQKTACIAQVWMFDADQKKWHPLTAPYGG